MKRYLIILFVSCYSVSGQTPMGDADAAVWRNRVIEKARATRTLVSDFLQYKHLDFLNEPIASAGTLSYKAPDWVKWSYSEPFQQQMIFRDNRLYIESGGEKSTVEMGGGGIFNALNALVTSSITGDMFDASRFTIAYYSESGEAVVHFMPRDPDFQEVIELIVIRFNTDAAVSEVRLVEPTGDFTRIVFTNRIENQQLPDAAFDY